MFKMVVHVTKLVETVTEAQELYEEIRGELRKYPTVHINCQIVTKLTGYSPEHPQGHEVHP